MDLNQMLSPTAPNFNEETDYAQARRLFLQGYHVYTRTGRPTLSDWRYDSSLYCFHRAVLALNGQAITMNEQQLLSRSQYYLYKTYYGHTRRSDKLAERLKIDTVEAALAGSPVRRHRAIAWLVKHLKPFSKLVVGMFDLYDWLRSLR